METIDLNAHEMEIACLVGVRHRSKTQGASRLGVGTFNDWQIALEGCLGEMALAKKLGWYWDGKGVKRAPDVGQVDVRTTPLERGRLILHPDDPDERFVCFQPGLTAVIPTAEEFSHGRVSRSLTGKTPRQKPLGVFRSQDQLDFQAMKYGSVCSGIEAATVALPQLGWEAQFSQRLRNFHGACCKDHYPDVPLHGDFTTIGAKDYGSDLDVLIAGTPCQSFSVAGLRGGLDDDRGNLALQFLKLVNERTPLDRLGKCPRSIVIRRRTGLWCLPRGLGELGYGFAWTILDAQYAGLAQRRRRVFVVGHFERGNLPQRVLFDETSLRWDSPPRREPGSRLPESLHQALLSTSAMDRTAELKTSEMSAPQSPPNTEPAEGTSQCSSGHCKDT